MCFVSLIKEIIKHSIEKVEEQENNVVAEPKNNGVAEPGHVGPNVKD